MTSGLGVCRVEWLASSPPKHRYCNQHLNRTISFSTSIYFLAANIQHGRIRHEQDDRGSGTRLQGRAGRDPAGREGSSRIQFGQGELSRVDVTVRLARDWLKLELKI